MIWIELVVAKCADQRHIRSLEHPDKVGELESGHHFGVASRLIIGICKADVFNDMLAFYAPVYLERIAAAMHRLFIHEMMQYAFVVEIVYNEDAIWFQCGSKR